MKTANTSHSLYCLRKPLIPAWKKPFKGTPSPLFAALLITIAVVSSAFSPGALAGLKQWLPTERRVPGGIALVDVSHYQPGLQVFFNNQPVIVVREDNAAIAVVGIPLSLDPSAPAQLMIHSGKRVIDSVSFELSAGHYPTEHLTISDQNKVTPDAESLRRIRAESAEISVLLKNIQYQHINFSAMQLPTKGRRSSSFGRRRFINGQPRKPHSGIDIAAPTGTPVYAPAAGIVTGSGDYFFNGHTLFLDHGQGLVSMFCHLTETLAAPGDEIKQGDLIARVGSSGRVTGPHLHWSLSLNDARIDPELFLAPITVDADGTD